MSRSPDRPSVVVLLQSPTGPIVPGRLPGEAETFPVVLTVAIEMAKTLKWCFIAELCVFFVLGLNNIFLMAIPWVGIVGWIAVNNLQTRILAAIAAVQLSLSCLGSFCFGIQVTSNSGACRWLFDIPGSASPLSQVALIIPILVGLSGLGVLTWQFRTFIAARLERQDRARLIALS